MAETRQLSERRKNAITWHFKDLLNRDIEVAMDCVEWLKPKQREIDRRSRPKRITARYLAACMVLEATTNAAYAKEILDRTEGKVADKLEVNQKKTVNVRIELAHTPLTALHEVIPGQLVTENALEHGSSVAGLAIAAGAPVESNLVPSGGGRVVSETPTLAREEEK